MGQPISASLLKDRFRLHLFLWSIRAFVLGDYKEAEFLAVTRVTSHVTNEGDFYLVSARLMQLGRIHFALHFQERAETPTFGIAFRCIHSYRAVHDLPHQLPQ